MKYEDYFSMFLNIEDDLADFLNVMTYSEKHRTIYSHKLVLLLLQTCPVIESYLVMSATKSNIMQSSEIWDVSVKHKIWTSKKEKLTIKEGHRLITGFPKFACVNDQVFHLSHQRITFYHSELFQQGGGCETSKFRPFQSLSKTLPVNHQDYQNNNTRYPKGYETPAWWTAYNKIKHSFDGIAQEKVNYAVIIEALAGLFCILAYIEPNFELLRENGYLKGNKLKSRFFEADIILNMDD
ncbi:hypothetical protein [uncultured Psychromonas sp.]|uniref:hypothetical protein n=1 Tax=uncultured Psychromonas sp. TaxID=173974 RepID=UPI002636AA36|nr:hypothetical protein [uncultured Psychromonas sp.]